MKKLMFLLVFPVVMYSQGIITDIPQEGVGEKDGFLRVVSTSTGSSVVGAEIKNRTYATGSRTLTTSVKFPTTVNADSALGDNQWSDLTNVSADDGSSATSVSVATNDSTHYLYANDFVFSLPADAIITGFTVTMEASATDSVSYLNVVTRLVKGGTITGSDYAVDTLIDDDATVYTFGGADSLWGTTWTIANVTDSAFGVVLMFEDTSTAAEKTISVDYVTVTVHYTYLALSVSADTTQMLPTFRGKSFWLQLAAKDSISLMPEYQLSLDGISWAAAVPMDSLKQTSQAYLIKSLNVSAPADTARFIRFLLNITRNAYAPGVTTATYSASYAIKRD